MKHIISFLLMFGFFIWMLLFPRETFLGATSGLLLWFQTLLPTLLPFVILSNLLIQTNAVQYISRMLKPFLQKIFGVSENACYAVFVGFLCGYPMGAKVVADLLDTGRITRTEGEYLLSFCNNTSLIFITSFLVIQNFKDETFMLGTICILFLSPIICSFLFRKYYKINFSLKCHNPANNSALCFQFEILDTSIMNSFETITRVGGYVILFSILFTLCKELPFQWFLPTLEITNGIPLLFSFHQPLCITYPLTLALTSFGGLCSVAQTYSMIQKCKIPIIPYIIQKLITAMVTSLLATVYINFIHR